MLPKLSIIIASHEQSQTIFSSLSILAGQIDEDIEVLVVGSVTEDTIKMIARQFPWAKHLPGHRGLLVPQLWETGIRCSKGEIIALTTSHFVPDNFWIAKILSAHLSDYAGVGGAIENSNSSIICWGVYFCRYTPYMLPFSQQDVLDFAADNASYKRTAIDKCHQQRRDGFWEPFVHAQLHQLGEKLSKDPSIVVYQREAYNTIQFIRQRFIHGRQFGTDRQTSFSKSKKIAYITLSPLIPIVLLWRIAQQVRSKGQNLLPFAISTPLLFIFLLSWSIGEVSGYILPKR